jgi:hypothetical protein
MCPICRKHLLISDATSEDPAAVDSPEGAATEEATPGVNSPEGGMVATSSILNTASEGFF